MLSSSEPACKTQLSSYELGYIEFYSTPCGKGTAIISNQALNSEICCDYSIRQNPYFTQQQLKSSVMRMYLVFLRISIIGS